MYSTLINYLTESSDESLIEKYICANQNLMAEVLYYLNPKEIMGLTLVSKFMKSTVRSLKIYDHILIDAGIVKVKSGHAKCYDDKLVVRYALKNDLLRICCGGKGCDALIDYDNYLEHAKKECLEYDNTLFDSEVKDKIMRDICSKNILNDDERHELIAKSLHIVERDYNSQPPGSMINMDTILSKVKIVLWFGININTIIYHIIKKNDPALISAFTNVFEIDNYLYKHLINSIKYNSSYHLDAMKAKHKDFEHDIIKHEPYYKIIELLIDAKLTRQIMWMLSETTTIRDELLDRIFCIIKGASNDNKELSGIWFNIINLTK